MSIKLKRWLLPVIGVASAAFFVVMSMSATGRPTAEQITANLEASVGTDSHSWFMNKYDPGSLTGLQIVQQENAHSQIVKANYTYNNGNQGWVMARVIDGNVQCLQYWDKNFCKLVGAYAEQGQQINQTAEQQQPDNSILECGLNHGLVGQFCKDAGIGVDADNSEEHNDSSPPEQPADNNAGGGRSNE